MWIKKKIKKRIFTYKLIVLFQERVIRKLTNNYSGNMKRVISLETNKNFGLKKNQWVISLAPCSEKHWVCQHSTACFTHAADVRACVWLWCGHEQKQCLMRKWCDFFCSWSTSNTFSQRYHNTTAFHTLWHTHTHTHTHRYTNRHSHPHARPHSHTHVLTHARTQLTTHTHTHTHTHTLTHTQACTWVNNRRVQ